MNDLPAVFHGHGGPMSHDHEGLGPAHYAFDSDGHFHLTRKRFMIWNCEMKGIAVSWAYETMWPLNCPICGAAVHPNMSTHHELASTVDDIEYTEPPNRVIDNDPEVEWARLAEWAREQPEWDEKCPQCGVLVLNIKKHEAWHEEMGT